jgi:hypothetical protein
MELVRFFIIYSVLNLTLFIIKLLTISSINQIMIIKEEVTVVGEK